MNLPEAPIRLAEGGTDLWLCFHDEQPEDPAWSECCRGVLEPHELEKQARFHFARDRYRYALTRYMVRVVLSRYTGLPPSALRFVANPFGRPRLVDAGSAAMDGLDFNLSHTRGLVVLAVSGGTELGVDAESLARPAMLGLVDSVFSANEARALRALSPRLQATRFYEVWTLKESYVKARGMGLNIPLEQVDFGVGPDGRIELHLDARLQDSPGRWSFWQSCVRGSHVVALCVQSPARVVCREASPSALMRAALEVPGAHRVQLPIGVEA